MTPEEFMDELESSVFNSLCSPVCFLTFYSPSRFTEVQLTNIAVPCIFILNVEIVILRTGQH